MAQLPFVLPVASLLRQQAGAELRALSAEAARGDRPVAELLARLAEAVEQDRRDEVRAYVAAIPPRAVADATTFTHRSIWGVAEVVRGALVLLPIAVTWYGLSAAAHSYGQLLETKPDLVGEPFLLLWQQGFQGATPLTFSVLAAIDGLLISVIIALSLVIHYKADVRDPRERAKTLLKESEVRGALARALSLAGRGDGEAEYREGDSARDTRLIDLERSFSDVRHGVMQLGAYAEATAQSTERVALAQEALLAHLSVAADRQVALTEVLQSVSERMASGSAAAPAQAQLGIGGIAALAVGTTLEEQERLLRDLERLLDSLQQVKKAQQVTAGSVTLQTDALHYLAKALVLSSERVQEASQALGDAAAPGFVAQLRPRRVAVAALIVVVTVALVAGTAVAAPRLLQTDAQRYAGELRAQSQGLVGLQQVHLLLPPPRSAANDASLRDTVTSLEDAATRIERWVDTHPAPPDGAGLAAGLRSVTAATHRASQGLLTWLAASPAGGRSPDAAPPAAVLADLGYAETLARDLTIQLAQAR